ncbi:MAG: FecR domain-containing protein [Pseudomonadota bacterium]
MVNTPSDPDQFALEREAFALLEAFPALNSSDSVSAQNAFRARSPAHAAALESAIKLVALSRQAQRPHTGSVRRAALKLQLMWLQVAERPAALASVVLLVGLAALGLLVSTPVTDSPASVVRLTEANTMETLLQTRLREQREETLSDGSTLWLGWDSAIEIRFTATTRRMVLTRGVAAFKVISDAGRPFIVSANGTETRVTGTEFVVDMQQRDSVEIAVIEGQVIVSNQIAESVVLKGAQAVGIEDNVIGSVLQRPVNAMGRWRDGMLVFDDRPLLDALADIEPYSQFELDTSAISGHLGRVSGIFFIERADDALLSIAHTHQLDANLIGKRTLRLSPTLQIPLP